MKTKEELSKEFNKPIGDFLTRMDGRIEWTCEHGVGHTVAVPDEYKDSDAWWLHGCDGCCSKLVRRKKKRK